MILDEVYCGTGTSGKVYCCDYDHVKPDFIFIGKTLAAGYGAISAVITSSTIEDVIRNAQGRLQHTTTHQAHSLSIAAALAVQKVVHNDEFLTHVDTLGSYMRQVLTDELGELPIYRDVRGRGLRFSLEYQAEKPNEFGMRLAERLLSKHNILINAKWHRVCFTPGLIMTKEEADQVLDACISEIKNMEVR